MFTAYSILQVAVWLMCHAAALFWKIGFPLRARLFTLEKKDKYVHLICVVVGLILPLVTVIVPIIDTAVHIESQNSSLASSGFGYRRSFTGRYCYGYSRAATLSFTLPISFVIPLTITLIILVCFYIHKVS